MRVGICDDDDSFIEIVKHTLLKYVNKDEIIVFKNDDMLVMNILDEKLDVLFLDIEMPFRNGIEIGDKLAKVCPELNIIFLTNKAEMVFRALYCQPFRFIRKNRINEEFDEAITSLKKKVFKENYILEFPSKNETYKLKLTDITYMESKKHYIDIHMNDSVLKVRGKLSDYEERLCDYGFFRTHVGFLVNVRFVYRITASMVELDDKTKLPVSKKYSSKAREEYNIGMRRFANGLNV